MLIDWRATPRVHLTKDDEPVSSNDRGRRIAIGNGMNALMLVCLPPYILAIVILNQAYMLAVLWASNHVARRVVGFIIPVTWILMVDGSKSIIGIVLAVEIWRSIRSPEPDRLNE